MVSPPCGSACVDPVHRSEETFYHKLSSNTRSSLWAFLETQGVLPLVHELSFSQEASPLNGGGREQRNTVLDLFTSSHLQTRFSIILLTLLAEVSQATNP